MGTSRCSNPLCLRYNTKELSALGIPSYMPDTAPRISYTATGLALGASWAAVNLTAATAIYAVQMLARVVPHWPVTILQQIVSSGTASTADADAAATAAINSLTCSLSRCMLSNSRSLTLRLTTSSFSSDSIVLMMDMIRI